MKKMESLADLLDQVLLLGSVWYGLYQLTRIANALVIIASPAV